MSDTTAVQTEAPPIRVLRESRSPWVLTAGLAAMNLFFGWSYAWTDWRGGWRWLFVALFGLGLLNALRHIARPKRLELSADGTTAVVGHRRTAFVWSKCGPFRARGWNLPRVLFEYRDRRRRFGLWPSRPSGSTRLPDTYGMRAKDLAVLLDAYRVDTPPLASSPPWPPPQS